MAELTAQLQTLADDNGTIPFWLADQIAKDHGVWDDFRTEYGKILFNVDAGEYLVWLGY